MSSSVQEEEEEEEDDHLRDGAGDGVGNPLSHHGGKHRAHLDRRLKTHFPPSLVFLDSFTRFCCAVSSRSGG